MIWVIIALSTAFIIFFMMLYDICDNEWRIKILSTLCIGLFIGVFFYLFVYLMTII